MNFKESLNKLRNMSDEEIISKIEKATGKELVSYEGIDALVAALMGFYNGELKKKSSTGHKHTKEEITDFTHNHDDRYNTESEINDKLNTKLDKGGLPTKITNAKSLYDLIENNSGLNFDTNLLYLNDAGTKTQGKIYFDKNKKGMFKCIKQTTGVVNSTEFFADISNNASSDKLENLITIKKYNSDEIFYCDEKEEIISGLPCLEIKFNNIIIITGRVGGCSSYILKDHIKNSMNILSMFSNSDAPDGKTAEPVSVVYNRGKFVLPHSRMIHFTLIAKL